MNWAEQLEPGLADLEAALADDTAWHASMRRLRVIMALRCWFAGHRWSILATVVAVAVVVVTAALGSWLIVPNSANIAALLAGCAVLGGIAFAATFAVLDPNAAPPVRERAPR